MFGGDDPALGRVLERALASARALGHSRVGGEHLLLALAASAGTAAGGGTADGGDGVAGTVRDVLDRNGVTATALRRAAQAAAPWGAGATADRSLLAPLGIDFDRLLRATGIALLDHPVRRRPLFPLGAAAARRRCARLDPPLGSDARAAWEASLRLALARRERRHRPEHLALILLSLDPGVAWVLTRCGIDRNAVIADLAATFPPPRRNLLLRADRRIGHRSRRRGLVRRYQYQTGRSAADGMAVAGLIAPGLQSGLTSS